MTNNWNPNTFKNFSKNEHDACGIVAAIEKQRVPTKANIDTVINALITMNHRAGFINGEGDGVGIHLDIPKKLWKEKLLLADVNPSIADNENFIVAHIFIKKSDFTPSLKNNLISLIQQKDFTICFESNNVTSSTALGPMASQEEPVFWQLALLPKNTINLQKQLFNLTIEIEQNHNIHVASLSNHHVVYKVLGAGDILPKYYHDLANPLIASTMTLGHNRYSTNTLSNFFRVQPFSIIGHNGEINTIAKLRDEAKMFGVPLTNDGSDSQDLNRIIETFVVRDDLSLFETMDILFPPIINEIKAYPEHLQDLYTYIREAWGHFSQGPAGIISRYLDEAVFSVDALGLRPLWKIEIDTSYIFASEQGIIPSTEFVAEPKPFAPGEKIGLKWSENDYINVFEYDVFQEEVYNRFSKKVNLTNYRFRLYPIDYQKNIAVSPLEKVTDQQYSAYGWNRDHIQAIEQMAEKGSEPIRSLGHDAPLAAIDHTRINIADFIKESVAVVTNPAIDREREVEHFSIRTIIGKRPAITQNHEQDHVIELTSPILLEGKQGLDCAAILHQPSYDQLISSFQSKELVYNIQAVFSNNESLLDGIARLTYEAIDAVKNGKTLLIIDDSKAHINEDQLWIDPHLIISAIDQALIKKQLRRNCSLLLRSGSLRSLHDIIIAYGLGANVISPYLMFSTVGEDSKQILNLVQSLNKGLEKVISTIGIHELRGYGKLFSAIGLNEEIANELNIVSFFESKQLQYNFNFLKEEAIRRMEDYHSESASPSKSFRLLPRVWKVLGDVAKTGSYEIFREKIAEIEEKNPTTVRHLLDLKKSVQQLDPDKVNIHVGEHSLPFVISSMSFGSQNEVAFRAYAEAAHQLNMVSLNGEGGEIKDMLGKYSKTRGQQIASGRFGVNVELLNSSNLLEIKIGQGAKPGEGGHLPATKVTAKIASARNATIGSDLISPSNNHDIYSIEDLAQMITELKTANDQAKVAVKIPVVPNVGTIAVGIAKAGADIITLSGFDGGTGAARVHAIQHVGLPIEIGVKAAHNALLESGLRNKVEIWADGGIKSALDVLKIMLLGANRTGFGTLSMIAIGCTACRGCHLDTCHVGIATQIETVAQAKEHGLRRFVPRQYDPAVQGLINLFTAFGEELKALTASLGYNNLQNIVGRSDLLVQTKGLQAVDLSALIQTLEIKQLPNHEVAQYYIKAQEAVAVGSEDVGIVEEIPYSVEYTTITSEKRVLGSNISCHRVRGKLDGSYRKLPNIALKLKNGSIPGNGLGAYNSEGINIVVEGGAQDGIGKTALGGNIYILKAKGKDGNFYNGSVGKGFGYGAQKGLLIAQGNADARAGIRLSGADIIIGGHLSTPIPKKQNGNIGIHANIKGFAFEYMTNGRGLVLGDPGPWICAGMTGGVVYLRRQDEMGLTKEALSQRIAKGAKVEITTLSEQGKQDVAEMLTNYMHVLRQYNQDDEAEYITALLKNPEDHFYQVIPTREQADPSVSTE